MRRKAAGGDEGADRVLNQDEIDSLLGFDASTPARVELTGVQALINSALVSYERLPMLEIVFDRLVRLATTSLRNFTSDNVEVSMESISSVRFGDYLNSIPLPAILSVIKAEEWDNFGLLTVDSNLIYSMIDVLLGGRRVGGQIRVEGRPYTTIEMALARRMIEVILEDTHKAFAPVTDVQFQARAARDQSALRGDLAAGQCGDPDRAADRDGRSRRQDRDPPALRDDRADPRAIAADVYGREVRPRPDLGRPSRHRDLCRRRARSKRCCTSSTCRSAGRSALKPGETIMFDRSPHEPIKLRCGDVDLTEARDGPYRQSRVGARRRARSTRPR